MINIILTTDIDNEMVNGPYFVPNMKSDMQTKIGFWQVEPGLLLENKAYPYTTLDNGNSR